jgi:hypothetical protein
MVIKEKISEKIRTFKNYLKDNKTHINSVKIKIFITIVSFIAIVIYYVSIQFEKDSMFVHIITGIFVIIGLYLTWRRTKSLQVQADVSSKQLTLNQYIESIKLIKNNDTASIFGGIYSLEKIMNSNSEYHWSIVELLSAYVRKNSVGHDYSKSNELLKILFRNEKPINRGIQELMQFIEKNNIIVENIELLQDFLNEKNDKDKVKKILDILIYIKNKFKEVRPEIKSILTVIGRRDTVGEVFEDKQKINLQPSNLCFSDLRDTDFIGSLIIQCSFFKAMLTRIKLNGADLRNCFFINTDLRNAKLQDTNLTGAYFEDIDFESTCLKGSCLSESYLINVKNIEKLNDAKSLYNSVIIPIELKDKIKKELFNKPK